MSTFPYMQYLVLFGREVQDHVHSLRKDDDYRRDFAAQARAIPYNEWLKTPFWRATRRMKLLESRKCAKCGKTYNLEVHHITSDFIGLEILHLDCLAVYCSEHHHQIHAGQLRLAFFQPLRGCLPTSQRSPY